ncbi:AAA family ATPase [Treponema primitia]|uniref:AAA family ATPase n=1 Tax=Treponema primitia TaxID=88058 RepID=UPI00397F2BC0
MNIDDKQEGEKSIYWTAEELLTREFPPIQWIVPELITTGLSLLAGAPKLGKSWLMLSVAIAVASGERVFGKIPVDKAGVLYLALEDTGRRLKDRLLKLNAKAMPNLQFITEWDLGFKHLSTYLKHDMGTRLVIIDTWGRFAKVARPNDYSENTEKAVELKAIADNLGIAIVIVHHTRKKTKDSSKDWLDDVLGSQALSAAADSTIILRRGRGDKKADLLITGRDISEKELVLSFDLNCGGWKLEGDKKDMQESDERQSILEWIKDNGPHPSKAIYEKMKEEGETRAYSSVRRLLSAMDRDGALQKNNGVYALADRFARPAQEAGNLKDTPEQHEQTSAS